MGRAGCRRGISKKTFQRLRPSRSAKAEQAPKPIESLEPTLVTCFGVCAMIVYQLCRQYRRDRAQAASWSTSAISAAALGLARPHGMFGGGTRLDKRLASVCIAVNIAALSGRPGEPTLVTCFGVCAMIVYQLCRWRWGWRHRTVGGASTEGSRHAPRVVIKVG